MHRVTKMEQMCIPLVSSWLVSPGEKATASTQPKWPSIISSMAPVAASQSRAVWSYDPEARSQPPGEKATASTRFEWPFSVSSLAPVAASQSWTVWSPACSSVCQDALYPASSRTVRVLVDASLPPTRICPDPLTPKPSCSRSSVCQDALCPAPSPSARVLVDAPLLPPHTCPDPLAPQPGRRCSSVCQNTQYPLSHTISRNEMCDSHTHPTIDLDHQENHPRQLQNRDCRVFSSCESPSNRWFGGLQNAMRPTTTDLRRVLVPGITPIMSSSRLKYLVKIVRLELQASV